VCLLLLLLLLLLLPSGPKGGRRITPAGQKDMDLIAGRVECTLPSYGL